MPSLFSFAGKIRRPPYALLALGLFFSQHLVVLLVLFWAKGQTPNLDWSFLSSPLHSLVVLRGPSVLSPPFNLSVGPRLSDAWIYLVLAYFLMVAWALAALSFRRARDAGVNGWLAAFTLAPVVQIPAILLLCVWPQRAEEHARLEGSGSARSGWATAAQGVIAGVALTLVAVAMGALLFGVYGYGMFVISPFLIGAITAFFANRHEDVGAGRTAALVSGATLLGAIALVVMALEGAVCIVLAAPLWLVIAIVGGLFGRAIAPSQRSPAQTVSSLALLPLVFASETLFQATTRFDTEQTIVVQAPAGAVWKSIVDMGTIDEPPALPFRLGVAYPRSGKIMGEGVGATRLGEFSTGTAVERVTEWVPLRKLAFVVVNDVPSMRELSPYEHVHAPHVIGFFTTASTSFELAPQPDGTTQVVERTSHDIRLDPILYWMPMARFVVDLNNARVLRHIRRRAEQSVGAPA